jgi:hypothetical protein
MSSLISDNYTSSFTIRMPFTSFAYTIVVANDDSEHPYNVPILEEKISTFYS